jgi:hypothetical protein
LRALEQLGIGAGVVAGDAVDGLHDQASVALGVAEIAAAGEAAPALPVFWMSVPWYVTAPSPCSVTVMRPEFEVSTCTGGIVTELNALGVSPMPIPKVGPLKVA